jgi:hypothetical protein
MLGTLFGLARKFPSKAVADRVIPWIQLVALIIGGVWGLLTYWESIADQKAQTSAKLIDNYVGEQGDKPSLQTRYSRLWESQLDAVAKAFGDKQPAPKTDSEKATVRQKLIDAQRAFVEGDSKRYEEFSVVYSNLSLIVTCASEGRCNTGVINSKIGRDLVAFLNGACGYVDVVAKRWGSSQSTGQDLYAYVVAQKLAPGSTLLCADKYRKQP